MRISKSSFIFMAAALVTANFSLALAQTCNPNIPLTKPDSRYTYNSVGNEVTDTVTGLVWKRCVEGTTYSGGTCAGTGPTFNWREALGHTATQSGWRMPNLKELKSLVEIACYYPAINLTAFPNFPGNLWSASPKVDDTDSAWFVHFVDGSDGWFYKTDYNRVLLVRDQ